MYHQSKYKNLLENVMFLLQSSIGSFIL